MGDVKIREEWLSEFLIREGTRTIELNPGISASDLAEHLGAHFFYPESDSRYGGWLYKAAEIIKSYVLNDGREEVQQ